MIGTPARSFWFPVQAVAKPQFLAGALILSSFAVALNGQAVDLDQEGVSGASRGRSQIGTRGEVSVGNSFHYQLGLNGIFDNQLQPVAADNKGNLVRVRNFYGEELTGGIYGTRIGRRYRLGLDYRLGVRHYTHSSYYSGSDHNLGLSYRARPSRFWTLNMAQRFTTTTNGLGFVAQGSNNDLGSALAPVAQFFSTRLNYLQSTGSATWIASSRTQVSFGADYIRQEYGSTVLFGSKGYLLNSKVERRLSKRFSVGGSYTKGRFTFGEQVESQSHTIQANLESSFARFWTFNLNAGATASDVTNKFTFRLDPVLAAILGQSTVTQSFNQRNIFPSGSVELTRRFEHSSFGANYSRSFGANNGVLGASRVEGASIAYSRNISGNINLGAAGTYWNYSGLGQITGKTNAKSANAQLSYRFTSALHLTMSYDYRIQKAGSLDYSGNRVAVGIAFSPSDRPLRF